MTSIPSLSPAVCAVCEKGRAEIDCNNCKVGMCTSCSDALHKGACHVTYPYGQAGVDIKTCSRHDKGVAYWYGGSVGCEDCFDISVRSSLQDEYLSTLDSLHTSLRQVEDVIRGVESELNKCHSVKQQIQSNGDVLRAEITTKCEAAVKTLQERCTQLCNEVSMKEMKKLTKVSIEEDILRSTLANARTQIDDSKGLMKQRCSCAFFGKGRAMHKLKENKHFLEANSGYLDICKTVPNFCLSFIAVTDLVDCINTLTFEEVRDKRSEAPPRHDPQVVKPSPSLIRSIIEAYAAP